MPADYDRLWQIELRAEALFEKAFYPCQRASVLCFVIP